MIEGALRHDTEMDVEKQYVDTHGQSEVGFAFCHLLGFAFLSRLKNLKKQRLGKAVKTTFLCDYLRLESLRREIQDGLQVIENWNSANDFILYGKSGEFTSNRWEDQEILMLSLHLLQVSLVYVHVDDSAGVGGACLAVSRRLISGRCRH